MARFLTVSIALVGLIFGAFLLPASSQTAKTKKAKSTPVAKAVEDFSAIMQVLRQEVDTKPMREKIRLRDAVAWLGEQTKGKLPIIIADEAFTDAFQAGAPFLSDINVNLTEVPAVMDVGTVLRLLLAQVGNGQATYLIRQGRIEIVPARDATSARLLGRSVLASFDECPLKEVLRDLSNQTGMTVNLDSAAKDKALTPITATFRNTTLEDALVAVTEMADLKFVVLYNSVHVTIPSKVETLENEERKRDEKREERRDLMKLPGPAQ
jgi:hypothetical protein